MKERGDVKGRGGAHLGEGHEHGAGDGGAVAEAVLACRTQPRHGMPCGGVSPTRASPARLPHSGSPRVSGARLRGAPPPPHWPWGPLRGVPPRRQRVCVPRAAQACTATRLRGSVFSPVARPRELPHHRDTPPNPQPATPATPATPNPAGPAARVAGLAARGTQREA